MANKISSATKVVIPCRISFANIFEAKSINCLLYTSDAADD